MEIFAVEGIGEITPGTDLAKVILEHATLLDGDIVVISSKVVSKAEGRLIPGDDRQSAIDSESVRTVARRGQTVIAETKHGWVMAAAGVDLSDIPQGQVALLPIDSDASASAVRAAFERAGKKVGVIITDTFGRPWREGLIDQAIGVSGVVATIDHRGNTDRHGRELAATITAVADELASASELVRVKSAHLPVAVIRGASHLLGEGSASQLKRDPSSDWFRLGHREVVPARRTVRHFSDQEVPRAVLDYALETGLMAPAPHGSAPMRFVVLERERELLLKAMEDAWRADLERDGLSSEAIDKRIARGAVLHRAPHVIAAFVSLEKAHTYSDDRSLAERDMFIAAGGAAIENTLIALASESVGSAWISSSIFCPDVARDVLGLAEHWQALGLIAVGYPQSPLPPRGEVDRSAIEYR